MATWIGFEAGLIVDTLATIDGLDASRSSVVLSFIPFNIRPLLAIRLVLVIVILRRDFGPMLKGERRAYSSGFGRPW